jgi:hypothetical protein
MKKTRKTSSVPGQALGYSLQYTKMTELMSRHDSAEVEFEGLDDVSIRTVDGDIILYQTKSALESNPLTDRAVGLWKSLANWGAIIEKEKLKAEKLKLIFYVSNNVTPGDFSERLHAATTDDYASEVYDHLQRELWGDAPHYKIRSSLGKAVAFEVGRFFEMKRETAVTVIRCFNVEISKKSVYEELSAIVRFVDPRRHDDVINHACAWTKAKVDGLIASKQLAKIACADFQREITAYIRKFNERAILRTFAPESGPSKQERDKLLLSPFVRQLELIELQYEDLMEAISDFYRASIDRTKLGDSGEIHESSIIALDEVLMRSWRNICRQKQLEHSAMSSERTGELVYRSCVIQQHLLENQQPPAHFIPGCYHLLAKELKVGWHPNYEHLMKAETAISA